MTNRIPAVFVSAIVLALALGPQPAPAEESTAAGGRTWVVQKGDTLWDITGATLYDPFLWPRIWDRNREIENPHLISPGFVLVIPGLPSPESAPVPREASLPAPAPAPAPVATPALEPSPSFPPAPAEAELAPPAALEADRKPGVRFLPEADKQELLAVLATHGFIAEKDELGLGAVTKVDSGHVLLFPGDVVDVTLKQDGAVQAGKTYSLARSVREVKHPLTRKLVGELVRVRGEIRILASAGKLARGEVTALWGPAEKGDLLMERVDYLSWIPLEGGKTPPAALGTVLTSPEGAALMGRGDILFIDLGTREGVKPGDRLPLWDDRPEAQETARVLESRVPVPAIGEVVVVAPREKTAVARVVASSREVHPGARVGSAAP